MDMAPVMGCERIAGGLYEPTALDLDVAGLHQAFVRIARRHDVEIRTRAAVTAIDRTPGGWIVRSDGWRRRRRAVINAAGAWGDDVAVMAGVAPIGLESFRRTVFMVTGRSDYAQWPMVVDADRRFYFKPDGAQLLCSLAEEDPSMPMDSRPRMEGVALAIERINEATTLGIRSVNSEWTGPRTFALDRELVVGEDPAAPGFYWLVGQGASVSGHHPHTELYWRARYWALGYPRNFWRSALTRPSPTQRAFVADQMGFSCTQRQSG